MSDWIPIEQADPGMTALVYSLVDGQVVAREDDGWWWPTIGGSETEHVFAPTHFKPLGPDPTGAAA